MATGVFRLLADGTRVQLILLLRDGEQTVGDLAEAIGAAPTAISQHLAKLRLAGLVTTRRDGAFVHYALADDPLHPSVCLLAGVDAHLRGWQDGAVGWCQACAPCAAGPRSDVRR